MDASGEPANRNSLKVASWRRRAKARLVAEFGGRCADCDLEAPPFVFDFDHRNPAEKSFAISNNGRTPAYAKLRAEAFKCDLVCANCHRWRTHRQRCLGCAYCQGET